MALKRGALTFSRFFVTGTPPRDLRKKYLESVKLRTFQPLEPEDEAVDSVGWCVMERPFDLDFELDKMFYDRFVLLGLRIDKWRIPAVLLRAQVADEEQRMLSKAGARERITRTEREEIKLRVIARLRRKLPPASRAFDVCWDLDTGRVLLFTHSAKVIAEFSALFEKTFGFEPVQDSPYAGAKRAELPKALGSRLEKVEPTSFMQGRKKLAAEPARKEAAKREAPKRDADTDADGDSDDADLDLLERIESTRFLGAEFLLWVWLRSEFVSNELVLGEAGEADAWLEKKLVFEHILDKNERVAIRGAQPTDGAEAREAVRGLKMPVSSRVGLRLGEREVAWDLHGPKFLIGSAALPAVLGDEGDDAFLERTSLIDELLSLSDELYFAFLRERLSPLWQEAWQPAIVAWAEGDSVPAAALKALAASSKPARRAKRAAR